MLKMTVYKQKLPLKVKTTSCINHFFYLHWCAININGHKLKASEKGDAAIMQLKKN
jgi:hypothetical protein